MQSTEHAARVRGSPHPHTAHALCTPIRVSVQVVNERGEMRLEDLPPSRDPISHTPVSYTHLTLPTIYSV